MITVTEAQLMQWLGPLLWPFLRTLALFSALPVLSQRSVPMRVRVGLALFIAIAVQGTLPEAVPLPPLDAPEAWAIAAQQVMIGLTLGFAVRVVFAATEMAGELVGLKMGLNFAAFFDPISATQSNAASRLFGTLIALLFVVINGHLAVIGALVRSFEAFPPAPQPLAFLAQLHPQAWGAEVFAMGLWIALPIVGLLLFVNLVMGVVGRVAPQLNIFAIGFPVTLGVGLLGLLLTLPLLQQPFVMALERMLARFQ
ncbi:MAG: flagellar biosynthetic protein FliR [Aquabacterium sp.]